MKHAVGNLQLSIIDEAGRCLVTKVRSMVKDNSISMIEGLYNVWHALLFGHCRYI